MKQTSSALTFLMAQYRAIFKRAYVKGLASAVLLTAGIAAGQAQAANTADIGWDTTNNTTKNITISGTVTVDEGSKDYFVQDLTITGTGNLTIGSGSVGPRVVVNRNMDLKSGATLTVNNAKSGLIGSHNVAAAASGNNFVVYDDANTTFTADQANITVESGSSILFVNSTIADSTVTLKAGGGIGAEPGPADRSPNRGVLTLDGGTYTMANTSWLYGNNVDVAQGTTIDVAAAVDAGAGASLLAEGDPATTDIYAKTTGTLDFAGTLNVAKHAAVLLGGGAVNLLDGAVINSSGTLILGFGDKTTKSFTIEDGVDINHVNASDHMYAGSDITMSGGSLNLDNRNNGTSGWGLIGSAKPNTASQDFIWDLSANGGDITLTKSQIQMQNRIFGTRVSELSCYVCC